MLSGVMISTDFFLLFTVLVFLVICYVFCFSWVLYCFLFGFIYIFKCFWSQTSQGTREWPIPPPFLIREFLVLTRLKKLFTVIRKASAFQTTLPPRRFKPNKGVNVSIRSARSSR